MLVSGADLVILRDNLISGNDTHGIELSGSADYAKIDHNSIGSNAGGTSDLGNTGSGIHISSGRYARIYRNLIAGNDSHGIALDGSSTYDNLAAENLIGLNDSNTAIANSGSGVHIGGGSDDNTVENNTIAHNTAAGVTIVDSSTTGNTVWENSIHSNSGLGIDLNDDGVTANDAGSDPDSGPNNLQNYPVLTAAGLSSDHGSIGFNLHVQSGHVYIVDFYASTSCDSTGNGEGKEWLGFARAAPATSGDNHYVAHTFRRTLNDYNPPTGTQITATVTEDGNTSEFSSCIQNIALPRLTLSQDAIEVDEDSTTATSYSVRLSSRPSHDSTLDLSIEGYEAITVSPSSLTFTTRNWNTNQTVTVTAVSDDDPIDESTVIQHKLTIDSKQYISEWLPVKILDDDLPNVALVVNDTQTTYATFNMNEGDTATYSVIITQQPDDDVTVDITTINIDDPADGILTVSPESLTFTKDNYGTPQTVTLTALTDLDAQDDLAGIRHEVDIGDSNYTAAIVIAIVNDSVFPELTLSANSLTVDEGATATYTIVPASDPGRTLTIRPTSSDTQSLTVSPSSLTFTPGTNGNWQTPQTVTVTGVLDDDEFDDIATISHLTTHLDEEYTLGGGVEVTVADGNRAPFFEEGLETNRSIDENSATRTAVGEPVVATDLNNNDTLTYSIVSQVGGPYTVDSTTGQIRLGTGANLDYERSTAQEVTLKVADADGLSDTIEVQIEIADVNEPPLVTGVGGSEDTTFPENSTSTVSRFRATDPEGDSYVWSVDPAGDGSFFSIDGGGYLDFKNPPNFEARTDANGDGVYEPTVVATDSGGSAGELGVKVTVTDVNEPPTVQGRAEVALSENDELFEESYFATDPEGSSTTFTWSVVGTDGGDFHMNRGGQGGVLTFRNTPDYERPADSNRNNEYLVQVRSSDGQYTGTLDVTITVEDVNEPPEFTSSSKSRTSFSVPENSTASLYTYRADDPENGAIHWSVTGEDGGDFNISNAGVLTFATTPDFEMPTDADQNNEYLVTVEVRDDVFNYARLEVTVNVTNASGSEEPTITTTSRSAFTFQENGTGTIYTFRATDPQGQPVTWSVEGTDRHSFEISSSGALTFGTPPDFENPRDSGRNNVYEVTVVVTDEQGLTDSFDVTIAVTNHHENQEPAITTRATSGLTYHQLNYQENRTSTVYTYRATNYGSGSITWSVSGTDSGAFDISDQGALTFTKPPNYEAPADSGGGNDYEITVVATNTGSYADRLNVVITVTDVNEGPEITRASGAPGSVPETYDPTQVLARYTASDPEDPDAAITRWSTSGTDGGDFVMNEQGELRFRNQPDHERPADSNRDNVYVFTVRASDGRYYGTFDETVTVDNVNEPPTITTTSSSATNLQQPENRTTRLYTYRATDPEGETITWSVAGVDGRFFAINERGELAFDETQPPDYEQPGDSGRDNVYNATVRAQDQGGITAELEISVTVTAVNEGPEVTSGQPAFTISENQSLPNAVYTGSDPEGGAVTRWALGGRDGGDFNISQDGLLTFRSLPDYERPADSNRDNVYEVEIRPYDGRYYGSFDVTVTVVDVNEPPTITTTSSSATTLRQNENLTTRLYTYRATDPEGETITWSVGGVDGRFFIIDERGQFSFSESSPPDHENPGDSGGDNVYEVTIQATDDGSNTASLPVTVTVTEVNEGPEVTSGRDSFTVSENQSLPNAVYTGSDPEGGTVTRWALGGRDGGDFNISQEGTLTFRSLPDYERPADSNRDNVYEVQIRPYDGRYYGSFDVTVTVTDVNEPPTITTTSSSATNLWQPENRTTRLYTYRATDPEGETITWSVAGVDGRFFAINERGELAFDETQPPDYEQPGDSGRDNVYNATVRAQDQGGITAELEISVTVTAVNEGPEVTSGQPAFTISENQSLPNAVYTGSDPEGGAVTRWALGGRDGGDFNISQDGLLTFRSLPDYERPADSNRDNVYEVEIRPYDGRYYGSFDVTVTVTDVNEPPTITTTSSSATTLRQNENLTTRLYTYRATDPEGGTTITWSVGGVDGRFFIIDERGQFSFSESSPPDYEIPGDSGGDNVYDATIQVRDDGGNTASLPVTVTVTEVNEGPEVMGTDEFTIAENRNLTNSAYSARDPELSNVVSWRLAGRDAGDFAITQGGTLYFRSPPDYEQPADSNRDNVYEVSVSPSDGRNTGSFEVTVTVTDVNEPPEFRGGSTTFFTQPENRTSRLYTYSAADPEQGAIIWSVSGTDGSFFAIDERGQFSFKEESPPDFDTPGDLGGDNLYNVTIEARDPDSHTARLPVIVRVTQIDEGPVITRQGSAPGSVRENQAQTTVLARYTASDPERPSVSITQWSVSGRDGGDFVINALGELRFRNAPDYERPADSNRDNVYEVAIRASDGRQTVTLEEIQTVTVTDVDEAPTITTTSRTAFSQPENGTNTLYTFRAIDPEGGTVSWAAAGPDGSAFTIDERGALSFADPPDFDAPGDAGRDNVYNVTVQASDGSNTASLEVTVTVTNNSEGVEPTISTRRPPSTYQENGTATVYTFRASDPQRGTITWTLDGDDRGDFTITTDSSGRGVLAFASPPDFESPADANQDNAYELAVVATDEEGYADRVDFTITVTNHNEGVEPTVSTRRPPATYRENGTSAVYTFRASDPQRQTHLDAGR